MSAVADGSGNHGAIGAPSGRAGSPHARWTDAAVLAGLFAASVAVRAPYLQLVPRFTDEVRRILWSLRILDGGFWPLAYKNGYNGALMIYLDAAALAAWPGPSTPRWTAVVVASLAPPALFLLGRALGHRLGGLVAGLLLTTSFVPVVVYGHIPWAMTPAATLVIVGLWLAVRGVARRDATALALGAASLGLALQTHPLAAITLPGAGLWLAAESRRQGWPGRRTLALALAAGALAFSPLVLHHALAVARDGRTEITSTRDLRDGARPLADYGPGARALGRSLVDTLSAQAHDAERPRARDGFAWLVAAVALGATAWSALRGPRLAAAATASGLLVLPALVQTYNFPLSARYPGLLLPTIYLAIGVAAADAWRWASRGGRRVVARAACAVLIAALVLVPLVRLRAFYRADAERGRTNQAVLALAEAAQARWTADPTRAAVILDDEIDASFSASGNLSRVLEAQLALRRVALDKVSDAAELDAALRGADGPRWVIASDALRGAADFGAALTAVEGAYLPPGDDGDGLGLYRWVPAAGAASSP